MTWVDFLMILLIIGYAGLGFFTGVLQRMIGLVSLYLAFVAASNMGIQAGGILQQSSDFDIADSRIYGFFGIVAAIVIVIEIAATLARSQIKIEAIVFDRLSGVIVGVITAFTLSVLVTFELIAAGNPIGGTALDQLQQNIRDGVNGSKIAVQVVRLVGRPIVQVFNPVLPPDPQIFFGTNPVS
jgi:hypothetical protein